MSIASAVSAGTAIAAGAAVTFGSFLTIAGGMASALGLLSGDKDFKKLGGILSAAGGLTNMVSNAANAATNTATATADAAGTATELTGMDLAADGAAGNSLIGGQSVAQAAALQEPVGTSMMTGVDGAGRVASPMGGGLGNTSGQSVADSLMGRAQASAAGGGVSGPGISLGGVSASQPMGTDLLARAAQSMTSGEIAGAARQVAQTTGANAGRSLMDWAKGAWNGASDWVQKNPNAAAFAMQGLSGTMAAKQQQEALDYQKSLIERARQNLNSPVRLTFTPGG